MIACVGSTRAYGEGEAGAVGKGAPQTDSGHAQVGKDHPLERGQQDVDQAHHLHHHDTQHATRNKRHAHSTSRMSHVQ